MAKLYSVVAVIGDEEGRFLAVSRKDDHEDLGFAGGKIDPGETPERAIVRELQEETGIVTTRRSLRTIFIAPDEQGRLCKAFEVTSYKGVPESKEGAWVGWVEPRRLLSPRCTFRDFNLLLFTHKGIPTDLIDTEPPPEPEGLSFTKGFFELTGFEPYPRHHVTFLYGPTALLFCPERSMHQPRLTFDPNQFADLLKQRVLAIRTHLQLSMVPRNLFRYMHSLGDRCAAGVVAVSPHRPPDDWASVSSVIVECLPHDRGAQLALMKNQLSDRLLGTSVVVSRPPIPETSQVVYQA